MANPEQNPSRLESGFWKDLTMLIQNLQDSNHKIILMGDFNESIYSGRRKELSALVTTCGLIDPMFTTCPDGANAPTFFRGSHRIDYVLVDEDIQHAVVGCGILAPNPALSPAHRAVFCDVSLDAIFGMPASALPSRLNRTVTTTNIPACMAMLKQLRTSMTSHSLVQRCHDLLDNVVKYGASDTNGTEFASIDRYFREALLSVERAGSIEYTSPWSKKLHHSVNVCKYWRAVVMQLRYDIDCTTIIARIADRVGLSATISVDKEEALKNLRLAQWDLRTDRANGATLRITMLQEERRSALDEGDKAESSNDCTHHSCRGHAFVLCQITKSITHKNVSLHRYGTNFTARWLNHHNLVGSRDGSAYY